MRLQNKARSGFTLTEMMVATALILYIMVIISTAFRSGLDTFSKLSTAGKLQEQLTNTTRIIQRDLAADHFKVDNRDGFQGPKLSDQRLDRIGWVPSDGGFFAAWQTATSTFEPSLGSLDAESIGSTRNSKCFMRFTVRLPQSTALYQFPLPFTLLGPPPGRDAYDANILDPTGNKTYYQMSRWGKVEYFLAPIDSLVPVYTDSTNTVELFSLRRKFTPMSANPTPLELEADRPHISATYPLPAPNPNGDDILLTNVVSLEMKYVWDGPERTGTNQSSMPNKEVLPYWRSSFQVPGPAQVDWPFDELPVRTPIIAGQPDRFFDTWFQPSPTSLPPATGVQIPVWNAAPAADASLPFQPPLRIRIKAIQFKLRIWDQKTGQTRQVTIMQEV